MNKYKEDKIEYFGVNVTRRSSPEDGLIALYVILGMIGFVILIALLFKLYRYMSRTKRRKKIKLAIPSPYKSPIKSKCNPKLAKANNPLYFCNPLTNRWKLK